MTIRVIAICVFRQGNKILVAECLDSVKNDRFARPLGGGVEPGELSADALIREIREEIGQQATNLRLLGVLENIFTYEGRPGHEIVFIYDGTLADASLYNQAEIPMLEPGWSSPAIWRSLDSFGTDCRLVPSGLLELLHTEENHNR